MSDINKRSLGDTVSGLWTMARGGHESVREENRRCKSRGPRPAFEEIARRASHVTLRCRIFHAGSLYISTLAGFQISAFVRVLKTGFVLSASNSAETNPRDFLQGRFERVRDRTLLDRLMMFPRQCGKNDSEIGQSAVRSESMTRVGR